MVFPWVGLFEQIRLADVFVHYDDVQLPQGRSFITRVQLKTPKGMEWLTLPVKKAHHVANINETVADDERGWREAHLSTLKQLYATAPFCSEMLELVEEVYDTNDANLAVINSSGIERIARYFELECSFRNSSALGVSGRSSERLLALVEALGGSTYITGHGARNYLDHEMFEQRNVRVEYMKYEQLPYPQLYGAFTPFVSILDLIANVGRAGRKLIVSSSVYWKEFLT
jgi:WbqC-like protein family